MQTELDLIVLTFYVLIRLPSLTDLLHSVQLLALFHVRLHVLNLLLGDEVAVHLLQIPQEVGVSHHALSTLPVDFFDASDYCHTLTYRLVDGNVGLVCYAITPLIFKQDILNMVCLISVLNSNVINYSADF